MAKMYQVKGTDWWRYESGHSQWVRYPEACIGLVGVAASASELMPTTRWRSRLRESDEEVLTWRGFFKCPAAGGGDVYFSHRKNCFAKLNLHP